MKKSIIRLFAVLLSVIFCIACSGSPVSVPSSAPASFYLLCSSPPPVSDYLPSSSVSESVSVTSEPPIEEDPGYFILIDGLLVGSYHDGQWHGTEGRDISIADILKQDAYYCYDQSGLLGISKKLTFQYDSGLSDSFGNDGKLLIPYAQNHDAEKNEITFDIPYKLPQNLRYIKSETYNTNMDFNIDYHSGSIPLVLSTGYCPLPKTEVKKSTGSSEADKAAVKAELERLNIPGAPVNITECYDFDFDGDSIPEHFVFANNPVDEYGYAYVSPEEYENDQSGYYYVVLCKDQFSYKTVTSWSDPYELKEHGEPDATATSSIYMIGFFDLNNDGIFELCLDNPGWEGGSVFVCSPNENNEWKQVLTGYDGM